MEIMMLKSETAISLSSVMIDRIVSNNFMQAPKYPNDIT